MASANIFNNGKFQGIDNNGKVVSYGKLYITDTNGEQVTTYRDGKLSSANTYPIILTASGKADVYLTEGVYNITLTDAYGLTIWTINDYVSGAGDIHNLVEKDILVDNDEFIIANSENNYEKQKSIIKNIFEYIKTVDGTGSHLDADMVDGKHIDNIALSEIENETDLNNIVKSGMYKIGTNLLNAPPNIDYGQLLVIRGADGDTITQIATDYISEHIYWRSGNPFAANGVGSWGEWKEVIHTGNISDYLSEGAITPKPVITYLSKGGINTQAVVINGILYTAGDGVLTSSTNTPHYDTLGRGLVDNAFPGIDNFKRVPIPTYSPIKKVGGFQKTYAYALLENGDLYTWGSNDFYQCGDGTSNPIGTPKLVATDVLDVYGHPTQNRIYTENNLFILKADGLYGVGSNFRGQIGVGNEDSVNIFTKCVGLPQDGSQIKKVYPMGSGTGITIVLTTDGHIYATGYNGSGAIGVGNYNNILSFIDITGYWTGSDGSVLDIKASYSSTYEGSSTIPPTLIMLITMVDGTKILKASGYNGYGILGDGTTSNSNVPVAPISIPIYSITDIAVFGGGVAALCSNGDLWCWGRNTVGQLGDGDVTSGYRTSPILVESNVQKLFSDGMIADNGNNLDYYVHNYILKGDKLFGCGYNANGELGIGNTLYTAAFTEILLPNNEVVEDIGYSWSEKGSGGGGGTMLVSTDKGNLYTWGSNINNEISASNNSNVYTPVQVSLNLVRN